MNRRFGKTYHLHHQRRLNRAKYQRESRLATCFHAGILLGLFDPEDGGDVSPKRRLTFNGLHGVISPKILLFITYKIKSFTVVSIQIAAFGVAT
jgi:hypothetical protein